MSEAHDCDVAIIGAGPAGATLAALLAQRGVSVTLLDRDSFPRDKVCGEFLSYDSLPLLEHLGVRESLDARGAAKIASCRVVGRTTTYEFEFPRAARGVSRQLLDATLVENARSRGATVVQESTVTRLDRGALTIATSNAEREVRPRVIVGAWGRWGRFDSLLGRAFARDRRHRNFGFKRHYRRAGGNESDASVVQLYAFDRGYLGVNDVEGGAVNICGLVHVDRLAALRGRWPAFVDQIRNEEPPLDSLYARHEPLQEQFLSSDPVIFLPRAPVVNGLFLIGDASGVIDPLTGNGMSMAIQSAFLALPFIFRALGERDRARVEGEYIAAHAELFASRIRWSRAVAALLTRPRLLERLIRVGPPAVGRSLLRRTRASDAAVTRLLEPLLLQ